MKLLLVQLAMGLGALLLTACNPLGRVSSVDSNFGQRSQTYVWSFANSEDYLRSSSTKVTLGSGAELQEVDQTHDSQSDFTSGTHDGTCYSNSKLTLRNTGCTADDADSTDIRKILPNRTANLKGYWRFEGNYTDLSGNGNDGSAQGDAVRSTSAHTGTYSVALDGTGDYIDAGSGDLSITNSFTLMTWAYSTADTIGRLITKHYSSVPQYGWLLSRTTATSKIEFKISTTGSNFLGGSSSSYVFPINRWVHIAATYDNSTMRVYVNGVEDTGGSFPVSVTGNVNVSSQNLLLGFTPIGGTYLTGRMDETAIWNTALSAAEIASVYSAQNTSFAIDTSLNSSWTPQWSSLVGYWKMDGNWKDSANANNGTAYNQATFSTTAKIGTYAGVFDGTDDYIEMANESNFDFTVAQPFTVSAWIRPTTGNKYETIASKRPLLGGGAGTSPGWNLSKSVTGQLVFKLDDGATSPTSSTAAAVVQSTSWQHVVAVVNPPNVKLYYEGKDVTVTNGGVGAGDPLNDEPFRVGYDTTAGRDFGGYIDDVAVWSVALSDLEVDQIFQHQKQKYSGSYTSPVMGSGTRSLSWSGLSWTPELPFFKELPGLAGSESSSQYTSLSDSLMVGLANLYHFDETAANSAPTGVDAEDFSGNSRHLTDMSVATHGKNGILNKAIELDGTADYFASANYSYGSISEITMAAWVKNQNASPATVQGILYKSNTVFELYSNSNAFIVALRNSAAFHISVSSPTYSDWDQWHHLAATYDSSNVRLYRDGVLVATSAAETGNLFAAGQPLTIGRASSSLDFWNGRIDEAAVWTRALTATEIEQLYRRGANRIKYQMRSCSDSTCAGETWLGPSNTSGEYSLSELNNCSSVMSNGNCDFANGSTINLTLPSFSFSTFPNLSLLDRPYFQYRILMESEDPATLPKFPTLSEVSITPSHYYTDSPWVQSKYGPSFQNIKSFASSTSGSCSVTYQFSPGTGSWYYFNGSQWAVAGSSADSSSGAVIAANASTFASQIGSGTLLIRAFLTSDSTQSCKVNSVTVVTE